MVSRRLGLVALLGLLLISQACAQDFNVTLNQNEVTGFPVTQLFPAPSKAQLKDSGLQQAAQNSYTTSHPAAYLKTFDESAIKAAVADLTGVTAIDFWTYQYSAKILHVLIANTWYQFTYSNSAATLVPTQGWVPVVLPAADGNTKCTGIDFTPKLVVLGCLATITDPAPATGFNLYTYINSALVDPPTFVPFNANQAIQGRLRVEVSPDSDYFAVYDDMLPAGTDVPAVYLGQVDDNTGVVTFTNSVTTIDTFTPGSLQDVTTYSDAEGNLNAFVSFIDSANGKYLSVVACALKATTVPGPPVVTTIAFTGCVEQGTAKLKVTDGRAKYFPAYTTPIAVSSQIAIYNNDFTNGISVWQCLYNSTSSSYDDCQYNIRSLPNSQVEGTTVTYITNFDGNLAFNLQTVTPSATLNWALVNIARTSINGNLFGLGFDPVLDTSMLGFLAPTKNLAVAIFKTQTKFYSNLPEASWNIIIISNDVPANQNSNVNVNRALIQVTQTTPGPSPVSTTKWIRVWVLSSVTDVFGFTDNLPDFGALAGGSLTTNVDRTWVYGNNLALSFQGTSIASSNVVSSVPITYSFDQPATPKFTSFYAVGSFEAITSDATTLYYYTCPPNLKAGTAACTQQITQPLPAGFSIAKVYSTTSYPENGNSKAILVFLVNKNAFKYWYIDRFTPNQSAIKDLDAAQTFRDVHLVNYQDTLMIFAAPLTAGNTENVWVYTGPNTAAGTLEAPFAIKPADNGMPDGVMAPNRITSCGHNDYVLEFLSGNGYIIKMNIVNATTLTFRGIIRLVIPAVPSFTAYNFCPFGDEFLVWDDNQNIFTTSTLNDPTFYRLNIANYGIDTTQKITIRCSRLSAAASLWGKNTAGDVIVATVFGNQQNVAHSKIHSVVQFGSQTKPSFIELFPTLPGAVSHVSVSSNVIKVTHVFLGGPYIELNFASQVPDPFITWTLTSTSSSGAPTRTLLQQVNIGQIYRNITVIPTSKPTLAVGNISLESSALIVGHVETATLNVPQSLQDTITLQQRAQQVTPSPALHGLKAGNIQIKLILGSYQGCILYLGVDNDTPVTLLAIAAGTGCKNPYTYFFPAGVVDLTGVDGAINGSGFAIAYVNKIGGAYTTSLVYHSFTQGAKDIIVVNANPNRGYISTVRVAPWPDWQHFAVVVGVRIHDRCDVMVADLTVQAPALNDIDSVNSCYNVWPVANGDGAMFFWNNYRDTVLNLYSLNQPTNAGTSQLIGFDGSNNEFRDVKCVAGDNHSFNCAAVTFGPTSTYFTVALNATNWNVLSTTTRALQNFMDTTGAGSYHSVDIIDGYAVLSSRDGFLDLYKTDANQSGYLYTRLPQAQASGLGDSLIHDVQYKNYALYGMPSASGNGWTPMVSRLSNAQTALNDVTDQTQSFSIQPLTLQVTQQPNGDDANSISIGFGSGASSTSIPFDDFFTPKKDDPPTPTPDKGSSLLWLWIILIIVGVGAIGAGVFFVLKNRKERGAEEGAYYEKNEPLADGDKKKSGKVDDEFN